MSPTAVFICVMYLTPGDSAPVSAPTLLLLDSSLGGLALLCSAVLGLGPGILVGSPAVCRAAGLGLAMAASDRALMSRSWSSSFFLASSSLN